MPKGGKKTKRFGAAPRRKHHGLPRAPKEDGDPNEHASAAEHATDSDDDDFERLRIAIDELSDDLDALVDLIGTGTTPEWHEAPDLATDLIHWLTFQEVPTLRSPSRLALDLNILLGTRGDQHHLHSSTPHR